MMSAHKSLTLTLFVLPILVQISFHYAYAATCEFSTIQGNKLYTYSLASVSRKFPHGVLSEDGFYKAATNNTTIWFQLCDGMIFNHDPPRCVDCWDCGGPSHCGMGCSALVAENIGGYHVCSAIGRDMNFDINLMDKRKPGMGVKVTMSTNSGRVNCSLSVSVVCDLSGVKEPQSFKKLGTCEYATVLRHPSGCPKIAGAHGKGWGWFRVLLTLLLSTLVAYLLIGAVYRYFSLGIRGLDVIPNLDFWISVPHRTKSLIMSLVQRFRGPTHHHRSSYSSVNF